MPTVMSLMLLVVESVKPVAWLLTDDLLFTSEEQLANAGADNYQKLLPRLGLSDTRPTPDPVRFNDNDPLGARLMAHSAADVSHHITTAVGKICTGFLLLSLYDMFLSFEGICISLPKSIKLPLPFFFGGEGGSGKF